MVGLAYARVLKIAPVAQLRADSKKARGESVVLTSVIGRSISTMDHETQAQMG